MLLAVNSAASPVRRHATRRFAWVFRTAVIVALLHVVAVGAPGAALAHDVNTARVMRPRTLSCTPRRPRPGSTGKPFSGPRGRRRKPPAPVAADPGQVGQWGPVVNWPVVGIHVALLPNGKVLAWDSVGDAATETFPVHDFTRATV